MKRFGLIALLCAACASPAWSDDPPTGEKPVGGLNAKEQAFVDLMKDAVLVGNFTVNRERPGREPGSQSPERYGIKSVSKVGENKWLVNSQIKYGKLDVTVPVPVEVHWADDTPTICVTDLSIPLVGDGFTARVMFYDGQYAGTWRHGKVTGLMFGKVEKGQAETPPMEEKTPEKRSAPKVQDAEVSQDSAPSPTQP